MLKKLSDMMITFARLSTSTRARLLILCALCLTLLCAGVGLWGQGSSRAAAKQDDKNSSGNIWQDVNERDITTQGRRLIVPQKYRTLRLNVEALRALLAKAPLEFTEEAKSKAVKLDIPLPDGKFARFEVVESPIMEPALAKKFPDFKTYRGSGLDDPTTVLRFDLTPAGFHAIILSTEDSIYIDPYSEKDTAHYVSYFKRNYKTEAEPFHCYFTEAQNEINKEKNEINAEPDKLFKTSGNYSKSSLYAGVVYTYRLALAATGEYTNFFRQAGDTDAQAKARALANMTTTMNRVNGIYGREVGIRMNFIANEDTIIYTDPNTDPYSGAPGSSTINNENQNNLDNVIGGENYDIGHVVGISSGGLAQTPSVCGSGKAKGSTGRPTPQGDPFDVDYVAHEMGHQFGANHTFNDGTNGSCGGGNRAAGAAYEPGSGSTIMAYAGICGAAGGGAGGNLQPHSDDYFHAKSVEEISNNIRSSGTPCGAQTMTGNQIFEPTAHYQYTVPARTPLRLYIGDFVDPDGDPLLYTWEEYDLGNASPPETDDGTRPLFRSYKPSAQTKRLLPSLQYILNNANTPPATYACVDTAGNPAMCFTGESLPTTTRTMLFRESIRDGRDGFAADDAVTLNVRAEAGPFVVTQPNTAVSWSQGSQQTVTWNVAGTNNAPINCANVDITLSTTGGEDAYNFTGFSYGLKTNTPNDGSEVVIVPQVTTSQARIQVSCSDNIFFDVSDANFSITPPVVTTAADNGNDQAPLSGSLREAILLSNSLSGVQTITFNIPGVGVQTIAPTTPLPTITDPIIIDGLSVGGAGYNGRPLIELNGTNAGGSANGLYITAGNSTIKGLTINRFNRSGILLSTNGGNTIQSCYIGTDDSGVTGKGNGDGGVLIVNSPNNTIGGAQTQQGNVISGNYNYGGLALIGAGSTGMMIFNNYVGTNSAGTAPLPNNANGIYVESANNRIGDAGAGNVLAGYEPGFGGSCINFRDGATGNFIQGNFIGTDKTGNTAMNRNGNGIVSLRAGNNTVGGTTPGKRNVISGNSYGIAFNGSDGLEVGGNNIVQGNYIGTNADGTALVGNGTGVSISNTSGNLIGGTTVGAGNVISGSTSYGVVVGGNFPAAKNNLIQGNYIGTNAAGTAAIPNNVGVAISPTSDGTGNVLGGASAGARNIISGNSAYGVYLSGGTGIVVQGNYIGTDVTGTMNLGNGQTTGASGVQIEAGAGHIIGGTNAGEGNIIAFSGCLCAGQSRPFGSGVSVLGGSSSIRGNSIYGSAELGINLNSNNEDGYRVNANDDCDADAGNNNLQNYPVITSASFSSSGTNINGTLNSTASTTFNIDFYANPTCDPSGHGEGQTYLGSTTVNTNGSCNASFNVTLPINIYGNSSITATATDPAGNTSEFSSCGALTSATPSSGQMLISEFRLRGPAGAADEFVELYNNTDSNFVVGTADNSAGWALAASDGIVCFIVPSGTKIPPRGHFLAVNNTNPNGYSLKDYGGAGLATGDATFNADIPDNAGLSLFTTSAPASFDQAHRIDSVGFTSVVSTLYREGAGLAVLGGDNAQDSFVRRMSATTGLVQDTNNNANDFLLVSTTGLVGAQAVALGAPGPENLNSPRLNNVIAPSLIAPFTSRTGAPNRAILTCANTQGAPCPADPAVSDGRFIAVRRKFTNTTGAPVTRLKLRIVDVTTLNNRAASEADLRAVTSTSTSVSDGFGGTVTVQGTSVETLLAQMLGGGMNSTYNANSVTLAQPLMPNAEINLQFLLGIRSGGAFRFYIFVEALP